MAEREPSRSALVGFRLLQGVGGAMSWAAALVWIASVAPPHRRCEVIGRLLALLAESPNA